MYTGALLATVLAKGASAEPAPLISAWFSGKFNFSQAAEAKYNTVRTSVSACGIPLFAELPGGPWYNDTEMEHNEQLRKRLASDIKVAKDAGLTVWTGYDALSFPARLVDHYTSEMVDPDMHSCIGYKKSPQGCLSFRKTRTREVFRMVLDEFFTEFPEVDGMDLRYGEDSSCTFNVGNSFFDKRWPISSIVDFLQVIREELCVKRNKTVMFRTWDTKTDAMHANRSFYEAVVGQVAPHPRLFFSVKHTKLDFWRRTHFNPTIGAGEHKQVIEVCTGNLYQGQGAYPSYIADGFINGFEENNILGDRFGLRDIFQQPTFAGIRVVSQGVWSYPKQGKKLPCERCDQGAIPYPYAWPWLEFRVLGNWAQDPARDEETVFLEMVQNDWGLSKSDAGRLRQALSLAMRANLYMETFGPFDMTVTQGSVMPSGNFMITGSLAGLYGMGRNGACLAGPGANGRQNACEVIPWMLENITGYNLSKLEKLSAISNYEEVVHLLTEISSFPADGVLQQHVLATARHGLGHARLIRFGFEALVEGLKVVETAAEPAALCAAADGYQQARGDLDALFANSSGSIPSLLNDEDWHFGGSPKPPGMGADVANFSHMFCQGRLVV